MPARSGRGYARLTGEGRQEELSHSRRSRFSHRRFSRGLRGWPRIPKTAPEKESQARKGKGGDSPRIPLGGVHKQEVLPCPCGFSVSPRRKQLIQDATVPASGRNHAKKGKHPEIVQRLLDSLCQSGVSQQHSNTKQNQPDCPHAVSRFAQEPG